MGEKARREALMALGHWYQHMFIQFLYFSRAGEKEHVLGSLIPKGWQPLS